MQSTCNTCKYFYDPDDGMGYCRRFPPTPLDYKTNALPIVDGEHDWCGEHEQTTEKE